MKTIIVIICMFCSWLTTAQDYHKNMTLAMQSWQAGKTKEAIAQFEQIAKTDKANWIPRYYQALVAITTAMKLQDVSEKETLIHAANKLIPQDDDERLNAEWLVLKALSLTAELLIDPAASGRILSPKIVAYYEAAITLEPNNPRAISGLAEFNIRSKTYTGGNTTTECEQLQKALSLYKTAKESEPFYPSWGQDRVEALLLTCKSEEK